MARRGWEGERLAVAVFFCHFVLKQSNQNSRKNDATAHKAHALPAVFSGPRTVNASHLLDGGGSNWGDLGFLSQMAQEVGDWFFLGMGRISRKERKGRNGGGR